MSVAESKTDLRGATSSSKSSYRNNLLKRTNANVNVHPKSAVWIYDVGKFVRSQPPESTWQALFDKLLKKMMPQRMPKHLPFIWWWIST